MGGCTPFMIFFYFVLQDTNKIFCSVIKIISGIIFQISGRWFSWQAKGGVHPPINVKVFLDKLATASRLMVYR